jgi:hypothetical protein
MSGSVTFDLWQDGTIVASVTGSHRTAIREIQRYALVYGQDGPVEIRQRRKKKPLAAKEKA